MTARGHAIESAIALEIERALGQAIAKLTAVSGGDIHDAFRATLEGGGAIFVKTSAREDDVFACEARGLAWLAEGPLRVPQVIAHGARFLALEWIDHGAASASGRERLGRGLASLHRLGAPCFGLDHDNWLATIRQDNRPATDWATFYGERRLAPLLRRARDRGAASTAMIGGIERVIARLPELVGPGEPPSRLHGDLWGGNAMWDAEGAPVIFDPAVLGGHREIDLAMMRLFGGFDRRVFAAYDEAYPLAPGHAARVPLYQLLPLLAHVVLFGGSYVASVEAAIERIV
jgi:fructosamine-3-kinase